MDEKGMIDSDFLRAKDIYTRILGETDQKAPDRTRDPILFALCLIYVRQVKHAIKRD